MKKRKIILAVLFLLTNLLLSSCSLERSLSKKESRAVIDIYQREVEIPLKVERIAALGGAARLLTYMQVSDKLVGVTEMDKSNLAAMPYTVVNADHFRSLASVGAGGMHDTAFVEEIVRIRPELVFAFIGDEEAVQRVQAQTSTPVIGLYASNMFAEDFLESLRIIGDVMGREDRSRELIDAIQAWKNDLNSRTVDIPQDKMPRVYVGAVSFRGGHGFEGTYANYPPLMAVNTANLADQTGANGGVMIDLEKITVWDPDIIFLNPANMHLVDAQYAKNPAYFNNLRAVKEDKVFAQVAYNYNWSNMELAIVDAYYAGVVIHPGEFSDLDFSEKADEVFIKLLGRKFLAVLEEEGLEFSKLRIGDR